MGHLSFFSPQSVTLQPPACLTGMMTDSEFEILARELRPQLVASARAVVHDSATAEDVAQDALLKLWTMRADLDRCHNVSALGKIMARRMALNIIRGNTPGSTVEISEVDAATPSPEDEYLHRERGAYIDSVLASLPPAQQTLIRLRHIEGYDNARIASLLGTSEGAVRTAVSRARRRVAEAFGIVQGSRINPDY